MARQKRGSKQGLRGMSAIPIIDLFAGPGGLGEGFSALLDDSGFSPFRIALSIEKDVKAHQTLELRSFVRQFGLDGPPADYYRFVRGEVDRGTLLEARAHSSQARSARTESWNIELGVEPAEYVSSRVREAAGDDISVLIGGPPCQAYSLVGRSRNQGIPGYDATSDGRHFLYREYLRVLTAHWPAVFVMENVKGLLSAKLDGQSVFARILEDLHEPANALASGKRAKTGHRYRIVALTVTEDEQFSLIDASKADPSRFIVRCEEYGVPQARHRLILLGIRADIPTSGLKLLQKAEPVRVGDVLGSLPKLRSGLSDGTDSPESWRKVISSSLSSKWFKKLAVEDEAVAAEISRGIAGASSRRQDRGAEFISCAAVPKALADWYLDPRPKGVPNHSTRSHMPEDLKRYLFASAFARVHQRSPTLADFPSLLLPDHKNVNTAIQGSMFGDRFRVQVKDRPSTTVTSHISKDGHYYIHYDPAQCRSLTAREAARLQTFPDNYFFCGGRTAQYHQIGNAVPPLLARQIARIVAGILL